MRFILIDWISELQPGVMVRAHKALSLAEEYLADHFPKFPVLPGVLMLEAMIQASAWLVHATQDFAHSAVLLKEARNVTYRSFVVPGQLLTVESRCKELAEDQSVFSASAHVEGREMVRAMLTLRHLSLSSVDASLRELDEVVRRQLRARFELLTRARGAVVPS